MFGECNHSRRNFTLGIFDRISIRNSFYMSYLLFADSIFHVKMLRANYPGEVFSGLGFAGKKFHERGDVWSDRKNNSKLKSFSNEIMQRRIVQGKSSTRNILEGGGGSARMEFPKGILCGCVFYVK